MPNELKSLLDMITNAKNFLIATGILTLLISRYFDRSTKRQEMFANAYKSVLAWREMLYKIRRRDNSKSMEIELIGEFHKLQQDIDFYQGMLSAENKALGISYKTFVLAVKKKTGALIHSAWKIKGKTPKSDDHAKAEHPNIEEESEIFLTDVRDWLSWFLIPKTFVIFRNQTKHWFIRKFRGGKK